MNILRIIKSVDPKGGGPIEGLLQQAFRLAEYGVVTEVVCLDDPAAPFLASFPLPVHAVGVPVGERRGWLGRYGYSAAFVPWLNANLPRYDVAVVEGLWNYATLGAKRALVGGATPYVVFTHGMLDPWFRRRFPLKNAMKQLFWLFGEGLLLNGADYVLFTTEEEKLLARGAFWPYRVDERVVSFGTGDAPGDPASQIAQFREAVPTLGDRPYLLFLSRIHPKKGCDLLLNAFAAIAGEHPDLALVMAGPDPVAWMAELKRQAERLGIADRVHWTGMLCDDVKWGAIRDAEAFVLPSHQENFGIAVAEAMAASTPVLITDRINIWREVEASGGGVIGTDEIGSVIAMLRRFFAMSPYERATMGAAARQGFLRHYEAGRISNDLYDVFTSVSARQR
ncbi:glycosyltransferase [Prosthecomicrobium hirschii]|uniref:glycosyltransferase n=1 Tax=Prosthecodimorpha hirschii TaxID=665126 RepID=UPI0022202E0C|nr:glycosyltransferase [Prosthecomicrobium hirschii]MCW1843768.1 glycosyltransferase [Prosthecomicrobium hirschii]